ncbi:MAG: type II toxin-antitoxin system Phd/YefM family antitoxin [Acetobacteraceae bacterium]|jgi:prevent-host-death family protein
MPTVNIHAAKSQLSRLLDAAVAGEEVIIAKAGKPVARLVPIEKKQERRKLGTLAGQFTVPDDFDDPLSDEILDAFEGR